MSLINRRTSCGVLAAIVVLDDTHEVCVEQPAACASAIGAFIDGLQG